jgi:putative ABC transport system permease protein
MPDWREYVRGNLLLPRALPEHENEVVEDLARQLADAYADGLRRGCSPEGAEAEVRSHISDWRQLSADLSAASRNRTNPLERLSRRPVRQWGVAWLDSLRQDVRFSLRTFARKPAFFALAVLTLALGIGANTAIFSVVNAVLLRPLPYRDSQRLVQIWEHRPRQSRPRNPVSPADFYDWRAQNQAFEMVASYLNFRANLTQAGTPERLVEGRVSAGFFPMLGVEPIMGRVFSADEEAFGKHRVAILSEGLWKRRFGADPQVVGKTVPLDGEPYTIIGVLPASFRFATSDGDSPVIWVPLALPPAQKENRALHFLEVIARLKPGVTLEQARGDMSAVAKRLEGVYQVNTGHQTNVFSLYEETVGGVRQSLFVLLAAVAFVLLIACANVANLLLLRATSRRKEIAIRAAIGAGRWRAIRLLLVESLTLALIAGALGAVAAILFVPALTALAPANSPRMAEVAIDRGALLFTFAISLLTGLGFGVVPAFQVSNISLQETLKEAGRSDMKGKGQSGVRRALIVGEVAIAVLLLVGAGLLIRSLAAMRNVPAGFDPDNVLTVEIILPRTRYTSPERVSQFVASLSSRLKALPGVLSVGAVQALPGSGGAGSTFFGIEGRPQPPGQGFNTGYNTASAGYFETMKIPLLDGRSFTEEDAGAAGNSVLINSAMAREFWPDEDSPVGKQITAANQELTIVGVVGDTRQSGPDKPARPEMFYPISANTILTFVIRTASADPLRLAGPVRAEVMALDPEQPLAAVRTMEQVLEQSTRLTRFTTFVLAGFAAVALLLAVVGLYGVMAFLVAERFHEIGVRMALGAGRRSVVAMVLRQGMVLVAAGLVTGAAAALALTRLMSALLFNVSAQDPMTIVAVSMVLMITAAAACYIPARRAASIDPLTAVRHE